MGREVEVKIAGIILEPLYCRPNTTKDELTLLHNHKTKRNDKRRGNVPEIPDRNVHDPPLWTSARSTKASTPPTTSSMVSALHFKSTLYVFCWT